MAPEFLNVVFTNFWDRSLFLNFSQHLNPGFPGSQIKNSGRNPAREFWKYPPVNGNPRHGFRNPHNPSQFLSFYSPKIAANLEIGVPRLNKNFQSVAFRRILKSFFIYFNIKILQILFNYLNINI